MQKKETSWGKVADWYDDMVLSDDSYQKTLILPNLLKAMEIKKGQKILDIGCGQGFFANEFSKAGAVVTGITGIVVAIYTAVRGWIKVNAVNTTTTAVDSGNLMG